jgi:hypothetical protein
MPTSNRPTAEDFPYTLVVDCDRERLEDAPTDLTGGRADFIQKTPMVDDYDHLTVEDIREETSEWAKENSNHRLASLGWDAGPTPLWDFIETIRDDYYEDLVDDPAELPLRVVTHRDEETTDAWPYDEYCEVYIRDNEGGEYVMWSADELYRDYDGEFRPYSELIQKVLVTVAEAYEEPQTVITRFRDRRTQVESA